MADICLSQFQSGPLRHPSVSSADGRPILSGQGSAIREAGSWAAPNGAVMTKTDAYIEIVLWNQSIDRLIRVLDRLELQSIRSRRELRAYVIRLEELRAGLNADFAETMAARERADEFRFRTWRTAAEEQTEPVA